jgi:hypothetical protein
MQSSSLAFSLARVATWTYIGSLVVVGSIALFDLCAGLGAMAFHLVATLLQRLGG